MLFPCRQQRGLTEESERESEGPSNSPSFSMFPLSSARRTASRCLGGHSAWRNVRSHSADTDSMVAVSPSEESVFPRIIPKNLYHPLNKKKKIHRTLTECTEDTGQQESL